MISLAYYIILILVGDLKTKIVKHTFGECHRMVTPSNKGRSDRSTPSSKTWCMQRSRKLGFPA